MTNPSAIFRGLVRGLPAGSVKARFVSGALWSLAGNFITQLLRIPAGVITARVLGAENYGALGMINSTVGMFDQLSRLRLGATATTYVAAYHRQEPGRAARIAGMTSLAGLISGGLMCVLVVWAAPWLCERQLHRPDLSPLLALSGVLLLWGGLSAPQNGVLQGLEKFRLLAVLGTVSAAVSLGLRTGGVLVWGLAGIIWAMILADAFDWLMDHLALRREMRAHGMRFGFHGASRELDVLLNFSLPATLAAMIVGPAMWTAHSMLARTPGGYRELGIFNAVFVWQALAAGIPTVLGGVLMPILSAHKDEDRPRLENFNLLVGWVLVTVTALPFIAYPDLVQLVHGRGFSGPAYQHSLILVMAFGCIESYNAGIARRIQVRRMLWWGLAANALWCAVLIAATWFLRHHGAAGLAGAYAIAYGLKTGIFAPLHIARGVVPRRLMLAPQVMMVWGALLLMCVVSYVGASLWGRGLVFIACSEVAALGFWMIWRTGQNLTGVSAGNE